MVKEGKIGRGVGEDMNRDKYVEDSCMVMVKRNKEKKQKERKREVRDGDRRRGNMDTE